ncbi:MAG: hypothetical protein WCT30_09785, partial [Desulfurivibrionaceae bacterium]
MQNDQYVISECFYRKSIFLNTLWIPAYAGMTFTGLNLSFYKKLAVKIKTKPYYPFSPSRSRKSVGEKQQRGLYC